MGVCNCSMFCYTFLYVHSSIAIILMGKRELIALLNLSSWCLVMVEWLFLAVPRGCLQFVIVVFPDHTHLLFFKVLKLFACSNQLSMNFTMCINAKMPKIVDILTFISRIKTASESLKARKVFIFQHFCFNEQLKVHAQMSWA